MLRAGPAVAALALGALLVLPDGAVAQAVCRPTSLGTVRCPVPPPEPRPILEAETQALDNVRREAERDEEPGTFVPARNTDRLGSTRLPGGARPTAPCRPDRLGNLRCP
jgi:hypothetical protein